MSTDRPAIGTPVSELETPALLIDLDALEHNYDHISGLYADTVCKMREHAKNVKTPAVLRKQISSGGTVGGVCAAKVSEAEVMVEGGITDVLITSQVITEDKIARVCSLAQAGDVKVAVDDERNLRLLSEVSERSQTDVGVVIEVNTSMDRAGIRRAEQGVELARLATELPGLTFRGVMSHQSIIGSPDRETRFTEGRRWIQMCLDAKDAIEASGIPVEIVSTGETFTIDVAAEIPEVTEVQGGTYALMGTNCDYMEDFRYAVKVLSTVVSRPATDTAIGDVGYRALAAPSGVLPSVEGDDGITVQSLGPDHVALRSDGPMPLDVGDQLILLSGQQDILVNRWDQFIGVRDGLVESVWPILARGCHH
jgi:D-serine deaminase-like pyridoxal phosphate-dependent protein